MNTCNKCNLVVELLEQFLLFSMGLSSACAKRCGRFYVVVSSCGNVESMCIHHMQCASETIRNIHLPPPLAPVSALLRT